MSHKHTRDKHASHNALGIARPLGTGAVLVMIGLCSIWGMGQIAIKIGNQGISPLWQAGLRSVGASLIILAWMALRGIPIRPIPGRWKWRLLIGAAFASEFICLYIGIGLTTAAHATLLLYSAPFLWHSAAICCSMTVSTAPGSSDWSWLSRAWVWRWAVRATEAQAKPHS